MKLNLFYSCTLFCFLAIQSSAQTTVVFQPDAGAGKDAYFKNSTPTLNQGTHPDFDALAWTNGANIAIARSIVEFDLSSIQSNAIITKATLSLYQNSTSPNSGGQHSNMSGSNETVLRRVTDNWSESTITWNNQPSTTTINEVLLPQSTNGNQDYPSIDVTAMVQDMINNPTQSFGFMLSLVTEQYYRSMIFSSSDHSDLNKHPKLVITYGFLDLEEEINEMSFKLYPNPASEFLIIENNLHTISQFQLIDFQGRAIYSRENLNNNKVETSIKFLSAGIYVVRVVLDNNQVQYKKLIVE